ncbi:type IV secretion-system coupling DNA-binding domain protein, partial [Neisseria gonorrhoeae]
MSAHFPENVYRSPYEWISVAAYSTTAVSVAHLPVPPTIAYGSLAIFSLVSVKRALSALRIMRFRKNIRKLPYYALTADEIPSSNKALFLGKGF